jgi:hypothetical protein
MSARVTLLYPVEDAASLFAAPSPYERLRDDLETLLHEPIDFVRAELAAAPAGILLVAHFNLYFFGEGAAPLAVRAARLGQRYGTALFARTIALGVLRSERLACAAALGLVGAIATEDIVRGTAAPPTTTVAVPLTLVNDLQSKLGSNAIVEVGGHHPSGAGTYVDITANVPLASVIAALCSRV